MLSMQRSVVNGLMRLSYTPIETTQKNPLNVRQKKVLSGGLMRET